MSAPTNLSAARDRLVEAARVLVGSIERRMSFAEVKTHTEAVRSALDALSSSPPPEGKFTDIEIMHTEQIERLDKRVGRLERDSHSPKDVTDALAKLDERLSALESRLAEKPEAQIPCPECGIIDGPNQGHAHSRKFDAPPPAAPSAKGMTRPDGKELKPLPGFMAVFYQGLAKRALELGYALAVHGTMARDLDVIAVPWFDWSVPAKEFVEAIRLHVSGEIVEHPSPDVERQGAARPQGRHVWSIQLGGGPYIDLSVMDSREIAAAARVEAFEEIEKWCEDFGAYPPDGPLRSKLRSAIEEAKT